MDDTPILNAPWPPDLDPATVPFRTRSVTILRRMGYFDDWTLFNTLTEADVMSWTNAGTKTVADIRDTGNDAIRRHHAEPALLRQIEADLAVLADEPWARHIWYRDPRFREFLPKTDGTVCDIATCSGTASDRRFLWGNLEALREAVDAQAALTLPDAVARYVEAITGWHGQKLDAMLAVSGLNGLEPITRAEGAQRLGVSHQAVTQFVQRLWRLREKARPPKGVWLPQVGEAERDGWPDEYTASGVAATMGCFTSSED